MAKDKYEYEGKNVVLEKIRSRTSLHIKEIPGVNSVIARNEHILIKVWDDICDTLSKEFLDQGLTKSAEEALRWKNNSS